MTQESYPNLTTLRQFVEIHNAGGMARAARHLGLTQPALSRNIKKLEAIVGAPLLDRHSRGTDLTAAGQSFLKHASRILLELEHGLEDARKTAGVARNELRIGAGAVFAHAVLPRILPAFDAAMPGYQVTVKTVPFETIEEVLANRSVDVCIHGIPANASGALVTQPVHKARRAILCAPDHPLMGRDRPATATDLAAHPFVSFAPDRHQMRDLDRLFRLAMLNPPQIALEVDLLSPALDLLRQGRHLMYGSSLLAEFAGDAGICVLETEFELGQYQIGFSHSASTELESGAKRLLSIARTTLQPA